MKPTAQGFTLEIERHGIDARLMAIIYGPDVLTLLCDYRDTRATLADLARTH